MKIQLIYSREKGTQASSIKSTFNAITNIALGITITTRRYVISK